MVVLARAGEYDLYIEKGATFQRAFQWTDQDGVAVDLTGCTAEAHVRARAGSSTLTFAFTEGGGGLTITNATEGRIEILATAAETEAMPIRKGEWDLEVYWPTGEITRVIEGDVELSPQVTIQP